MADNNLYVANGVQKFEDRIDFKLNLTNLKGLKEFFYEFNGDNWINLKMCKKQVSPDQFGKTHYVKYDDFKPEKQEEQEEKEEFKDDIPF